MRRIFFPYHFFFIILCFFFITSNAQTKTDSLRLEELFSKFQEVEYADTILARKYVTEAFQLAEKKFKNKKMHGRAAMYYGWYLEDNSRYAEALSWFQKSQSIYRKLNARQESANMLINIGNAYHDLDRIPEAINSHMSAAKEIQVLMRTEKDKEKLKAAWSSYSSALGNLGSLYHRLGNYKKGLEYQLESLEYDLKTDNKRNLIVAYNNIGISYRKMNKLDLALENYRRSLKISVELKNNYQIANNYISIGVVYDDRNMYDSALHYYNRALETWRGLGDKAWLIIVYNNIGEIHRQKNEFKTAEEYYFKSLSISRDLNELEGLSNSYFHLHRLYASWNKFEQAIHALQQHRLFKDSVLNENKSDEIARAEVKFTFEQQMLKDSLNHVQANKENKLKREKEKAEAEARIKKQNLYLTFTIVGFLLMFLIAFILFRSFRNKKRSNEIILQQKNEVEAQKKIIEEKHHEMTSSIHYAQRIQQAMLGSEDHWNKVDHFILFKPKDVVSGDFFWSFHNEDEFIWCAADCTGHGVPGAFMSLLGISFLNEIVVENNITDTAQVLNALRTKIISSLEQGTSDFQQKDGMDVALCRWNKKTNEIEFSGANNPLCIVRNNECIEVNPDKMPVGRYAIDEKSFTSHKIQVQKNDMVYVFSDGYADQFGGEKGKKYKYSTMKKKLIEISTVDTEKQKWELNKEFESWCGKFEQLDDICVIGVKIS